MARASTRRQAATVAHETCPRCAAEREPDQSFCLECGLRLPLVVGGVAALRRRWLHGLGWYPGDWAWIALAAFLVAAGGAAASIAVNRDHTAATATTYVAAVPRQAAAPVPAGGPGETPWPAGQDGWTVILASSPTTKGQKAPGLIARRAVHNGLPQVGVLDSSGYSSLHPGYLMVFSGVYGAAGDARIALETVRARGFGGAYVLRVSP